MSTSSDNLSGAAEVHRRLARLAIAWYPIDPDQVEEVLRAVEERESRGESVDFLDELLLAGILDAEQIHNLRHDHAPTQVLAEPPLPISDVATRWRSPHRTNGHGVGYNTDPAQMGDYRILRRLGQGGMGSVFLAFDSKNNRQVAVKVLAADQAPNQKVLERFQREGKHGAALVHANIVRSLDMGQDALTGLHYIALEYVDGPSAHDLLDRAGRLLVGDAVHIILDIARALEHAHKRQIIHRDIKPGNILLTSSGLAKLSDLGLAKRRDDASNLTHASQGIGTPYYMPYEQAMNAKMADERSDIYALGATLYHLVAGDVPFGGESSLEIVEKKGIGVFAPASALQPDVPARLDEILSRMLARDPDDRYQTISEVIVDLERANLAATIPSFANLDSVLQDPVARVRLTAPVQNTLPDLNVKRAIEERDSRDNSPWFLRYRDQRGNLCKAKAATKEIVQRVAKGSIPADAEAARTAQGPFKPLAKWVEFTKSIDAVHIEKEAAPASKSASKADSKKMDRSAGSSLASSGWHGAWLLVLAALGLGALTIIAMTAFVIWRVL